jgi:hypothetical protein
MTDFQTQFMDYIGSLAQYNLFKETIGGGSTDVVSNIWNMFFKILVDIPFFFLKLGVIINTFIVKLLDISGPLSKVQHEAMVNAKNIFVAFIGGTNGSISKSSGAWALVAVSILYLLYQFFNGKGNFRKAALHFFSVVMVMFFFFSTFTVTTGGKPKTQMGGEIVFELVRDTSNQFKNTVSSAMTGYNNGSDTGDFFVNYVLKPTANFANTGNPSGTLPDGSTFDYKKANSEQSYVDDLARGNKGLKYLKNVSDAIPYQVMAVTMGYGNLSVYFLPVALINAIISISAFMICILIVLLPLSAFLSFIPLFRNAFFNLLGKTLALSVAPALISVFVGFIFYLMSQIDWAVLRLVGNPNQGGNLFSFFTGMNAILYLVTLSSIFFLKVVAIIFLWTKRKWITQTVTGSSDLGHHAWNSMDSMSQPLQEAGAKAQAFVKGGAVAGAGYVTGNPQLMVQGASMVAPEWVSKFKGAKGFVDNLKAPAQEAAPSEGISEEPSPEVESDPHVSPVEETVDIPNEEVSLEAEVEQEEQEPYDWSNTSLEQEVSNGEMLDETLAEEEAYDWNNAVSDFEGNLDESSSFDWRDSSETPVIDKNDEFSLLSEPQGFSDENEDVVSENEAETKEAWLQAVQDLDLGRA